MSGRNAEPIPSQKPTQRRSATKDHEDVLRRLGETLQRAESGPPSFAVVTQRTQEGRDHGRAVTRKKHLSCIRKLTRWRPGILMEFLGCLVRTMLFFTLRLFHFISLHPYLPFVLGLPVLPRGVEEVARELFVDRGHSRAGGWKFEEQAKHMRWGTFLIEAFQGGENRLSTGTGT